MSATPRSIPITDKDLESAGGGGGAYSAIAVNTEHIATLTEVEDYETSRTSGWKWIFEIMGAPFNVHTAIEKANGEQATSARWKLIETIEAFDPEFFAAGGQLAQVDPNLFIGQQVGAYVEFDYEDDDMTDEEWEASDPETRGARYRTIARTFPLVDLGRSGVPVADADNAGVEAEEVDPL